MQAQSRQEMPGKEEAGKFGAAVVATLINTMTGNAQ